MKRIVLYSILLLLFPLATPCLADNSDTFRHQKPKTYHRPQQTVIRGNVHPGYPSTSQRMNKLRHKMERHKRRTMAPRPGATYHRPTHGGSTYRPDTYRSRTYRPRTYRSKGYRSKSYRSKLYKSRAYNSENNRQRERQRYLREKYKDRYLSRKRYLQMTPEEIQQRRTVGLKLKQVDPETESLPAVESSEDNLEPLKTSIAQEESEPRPLSLPETSK